MAGRKQTLSSAAVTITAVLMDSIKYCRKRQDEIQFNKEILLKELRIIDLELENLDLKLKIKAEG